MTLVEIKIAIFRRVITVNVLETFINVLLIENHLVMIQKSPAKPSMSLIQLCCLIKCHFTALIIGFMWEPNYGYKETKDYNIRKELLRLLADTAYFDCQNYVLTEKWKN